MKKLLTSNFIKKAFDGIIVGIFFILTIGLFYIVYAATTYYTDLPQVSSGSVLSSSSWNNMVNYVNKAVKQDSEVLTITGGKVGIGTTNPTSILDINGNIISKSLVGYYNWGYWSPSEIAGSSYTNAPASGTSFGNTTFYTFSNSAGELTISFQKAGIYTISVNWATAHSSSYNSDDISIAYNGTSTRYIPKDWTSDWGPDGSDGNITGSQTFLISALAGQNLLILPRYRVNGNGYTTSHYAYAHVVVQYTGN